MVTSALQCCCKVSLDWFSICCSCSTLYTQEHMQCKPSETQLKLFFKDVNFKLLETGWSKKRAAETELKHFWFNGWLLIPVYCSGLWKMYHLLSILLFISIHRKLPGTKNQGWQQCRGTKWDLVPVLTAKKLRKTVNSRESRGHISRDTKIFHMHNKILYKKRLEN